VKIPIKNTAHCGTQLEDQNYACKQLIRIERNINTITKENVNQVMIFSEPLSLVLTKMFMPPPVIAPEAPSDLPPWSRDNTMIIRAMIKNTTSYHCIIFLLSNKFALI
jgi:hypothetical protein